MCACPAALACIRNTYSGAPAKSTTTKKGGIVVFMRTPTAHTRSAPRCTDCSSRPTRRRSDLALGRLLLVHAVFHRDAWTLHALGLEEAVTQRLRDVLAAASLRRARGGVRAARDDARTTTRAMPPADEGRTGGDRRACATERRGDPSSQPRRRWARGRRAAPRCSERSEPFAPSRESR